MPGSARFAGSVGTKRMRARKIRDGVIGTP